MSGGQGAVLDERDPLVPRSTSSWPTSKRSRPTAASGSPRRSRLGMLELVLGSRITETDAVSYDPKLKSVTARRLRRLGALVLAETAITAGPDVVRAHCSARSASKHACRGTTRPKRSAGASPLLRARDGGAGSFPDFSEPALLATIEAWLGPHLEGMRSLDAIAALDLAAFLRQWLGREQVNELDRRAPAHWTVPTGNRHPIDYSADRPALTSGSRRCSAPTETPAIDGGSVRLSLHLLSPAGRPIQVTDDIARFWAGSYKAVRADLRGRYPRHPWPEDPLNAEPTARAKPRAREEMPKLDAGSCAAVRSWRRCRQLGWVVERFKAPVLKTGEGGSPPWVRIPPHPPFQSLSGH